MPRIVQLLASPAHRYVGRPADGPAPAPPSGRPRPPGASCRSPWPLAQADHRTDLLVPFQEVRNCEGAGIGCRSLAYPV